MSGHKGQKGQCEGEARQDVKQDSLSLLKKTLFLCKQEVSLQH